MILASVPTPGLYLSILAAAAWAWPALFRQRTGPQAAKACLALAWVLHGLALGWNMVFGPALFGFAPALSVTFWLVAAIYALEMRIYPRLPLHWLPGTAGSVVVLLALLFPGSPLSANASVWMPIHLALGVASYGLFATAVAHAWFMQRAESRIRLAVDPQSGVPLLTLERLTYRFVLLGFVLLSATLVAGIGFGEVVYGHALHRDHKTVFSVLSWCTFAALLAGRYFFGWRAKRALRLLYAGAGLLFLAYVGSRFVLEVILRRVSF